MKWLVIAGALGALPASAADLSGQLDWSQRVVLSTLASGVVERVEVQPGQTVRKGDLLLSLEQTRARAAVAEARAEVEGLSAVVADAKRELERANELYARTVSSTTELDAARLRHASTQAQLAAAQARLEGTRRELEEGEIRAPYDAVILERQVEPGMVVVSRCQPPTVLVVARADEMLARAEVGASAVAGVALGTAASVSSGGRLHAGNVRAVRAMPDGKYVVEVVFRRSAGLMAGQVASIRLP